MDVSNIAVANDSEEQLVVFTLGDESYGVNIGAVNTIIRFPEITCVPHAAPYVKGVMNLRGIIVPVIDLRVRFGLPAIDVQKSTRIVVVESNGMLIGMIVDAVTETLRLPGSSIEPLSPLVVSVNSRYLRGVGKLDDRLIILLSLEMVLQHDDLETMDAAIKSSTDSVMTPIKG